MLYTTAGGDTKSKTFNRPLRRKTRYLKTGMNTFQIFSENFRLKKKNINTETWIYSEVQFAGAVRACTPLLSVRAILTSCAHSHRRMRFALRCLSHALQLGSVNASNAARAKRPSRTTSQ